MIAILTSVRLWGAVFAFIALLLNYMGVPVPPELTDNATAVLTGSKELSTTSVITMFLAMILPIWSYIKEKLRARQAQAGKLERRTRQED